MLNTKFSEKEMTDICQIMKIHGTDCATLVDILKLANSVASNNAIDTFKHVRLMKEFGILQDRSLLCHTCVMDVINRHAETCKEYEERMNAENFFPCPAEHYDYSLCEPAVWMVDHRMIYRLEEKAAKLAFDFGKTDDIHVIRGDAIFDNDNIIGYEPDIPSFTHGARTKWLEEMFPDMDESVRHNPWTGFFCEKHVCSMRPYSNKITGYM